MADYRVFKNVSIINTSIGNGSSIGDDSVLRNSNISEYVEIDRRNYIHHSSIGKCSYTGLNTYIGCTDIGSFCSIARNVDMGGGEHNIKAGSLFPDEKMIGKIMKKPYEIDQQTRVNIGNDVWIGSGVTICKKSGISIGNGAVIGAGAVVTTSIPDYAIAVGIPAKVIKYRFAPQVIFELQSIRWWNWPLEIIKKNWELLNVDLTCEILKKLKEIGEKIQC